MIIKELMKTIKIVSGFMALMMVAMPYMADADIVSLQPLLPTTVATTVSVAPKGPLSCFDFASTIKPGSKSYQVRGLQYALIQEGFVVDASEYGIFGITTLNALNAFQIKYNDDILRGSAPTGMVGVMTRAKLNSLYGCSNVSMSQVTPPVVSTPSLPITASLNVNNVSLDSNGVTVVVCNKGQNNLPVFPLRLRLNGINRDFNVVDAKAAGACDTDVIPYATWGLTYDPGVTYSVVSILDPNNTFKTTTLSYPLNGTTTLALPAVLGAHLSVRGIALKSKGVQGTLCNLGSYDLTSFPVRITVNGVSKDVDVPEVRTHGQCQSVTWTYDMFGLYPSVGTVVNATINVDPNNLIVETNEFDNSATILGNL